MPKTTATTSFALALFTIGLLLFNWPLISIADSGPVMALYLFLVWGLAIAALRAVGRRAATGDKKDERP
jgi:hypothetical protein